MTETRHEANTIAARCLAHQKGYRRIKPLAQSNADEIAKATPRSRRVAAPSHTYTEIEERHTDGGQSYEVEVFFMTVTCARCGNAKTVHGHERASYDAACIALRNTCPKGEQNYYAEP